MPSRITLVMSIVVLCQCADAAREVPEYWARVAGAWVPNGNTRQYYVQAEEVDWNYAPTGRNEITGAPFDDDAAVFVNASDGTIGSTYRKCLYHRYTDDSFSSKVQADPHMGLLGPTLHVEVGDVVHILFRNRCTFPATLHPHGVLYHKDSEGAPYDDGTAGATKSDDDVPPGGQHEYTWQVPERAGPGPSDGSSVVWLYHSHFNEIGDTLAGLVGTVVVTARGMANANGKPSDVDREVFTFFAVMDENNSPYLKYNTQRANETEHAHSSAEHSEGGGEHKVDEEEFEESNLMHSINGYVFGDQPMITLGLNERVRWYIFALGTEVDLHTAHFHGNTLLLGGHRTDVVSLMPGVAVAADMVPDAAGDYLFHCHVNDHIAAGMLSRYTVV